MGYYVKTKKGINIFVEDTGTGKPVVFIHGWPVSHRMFEYQLNVLPLHGYRCIAIDLRGFGLSDKPFTGYSYTQLAEDIHDVLAAIGLEQFVLAGFSMGGAISIRYVMNYVFPKVNKLILLAAAAPSFIQREGYPYGFTRKEVDDIILNLYYSRPDVLADFGSKFFAADHGTYFNEWFRSLGYAAAGYSTIAAAETLRDEDLRSDIQNVTVPTYIMHGKKDQICPFEFAQYQHKSIQNSKLMAFDQSGHGIFYDELYRFNHELIHILNTE